MEQNTTRTFEVVKAHLLGRGIADEDVTMEAKLADDLDFDSLDTVELTVGMEERFDIELPDSELQDLVTVGDAVRLIDSKLALNA